MWPIHRLFSREDRREHRSALRLQRANRTRQTSVKLGLEPLEERWLPTATITVTTTADDPATPIAGQTTLRDAIVQANANANIQPSTIVFNIPTTDPGYNGSAWTIKLQSFLPTITGAGTTIDGSSKIQIDAGTNMGGLDVAANNVTIERLELEDVGTPNSGTGIFIGNPSNNTTIMNDVIGAVFVDGGYDFGFSIGIYVGTGTTNTSIIGNSITGCSWGISTGAANDTVIQGNDVTDSAYEGILVAAGTTPTSITIGGSGPKDGNYVAYNGNAGGNQLVYSGIDIYGNTQNVVVQGNTIVGTTGGANNHTGNGITIGYLDNTTPGNTGSNGVTIGGAGGAANNIFNNGGSGIEIDGSLDSVQGNTIDANSIYGVEIYAGSQDTIQDDIIDGNNAGNIFLNGAANNSIAAPDLISADYQDASGHPTLTIQGTLPLSAAAPAGTYTIETFAYPQNRFGAIDLGTAKVTASGGGTNPFTITLTLGGEEIYTSSYIMATVTDPNGNTSVFSNEKLVNPPSVITVTTTADDATSPIVGQTTLRDAIYVANYISGAKIVFNIPTSDSGYQNGVWTIRPTVAPPDLNDGITIDGTSQAGGALGKPVIVLDGSLAGQDANGLDLADSNTILGLDIVNWSNIGIYMDGASNVVKGNYIGIDPTGTKAEGNSRGIVVRDSGVTPGEIGGVGPGEGNVISGNIGDGIEANFANVIIEGNRIGTSANGNVAVGNGGDGVNVDGANASGYLIGGRVAGAGNIIAYNGNDGVDIVTDNNNKATTEVAVLGNSIYANKNQGIQLKNGSNNNQAAPDLATVSYSSATTMRISGTLTGTANTTYRLEFFANPPGNNVQGKTFLGAQHVTTNGNGTAPFNVTFNVPAGLGTTAFTATATDPNNNTSPFSNAVLANAPSPPPSPPASPPAPPSLNVPPLLAFLDSVLAGVETVNANGTETIVDSLFGIPLIVATFDSSGNLVSVTLFGFNITFLFG